MLSKRSVAQVLAAVLFSAAAAVYLEYLAFTYLSWTFKTPGDYLAFYFIPDSLSVNPFSLLDLRILVCFVVDWTCCVAVLLGLRTLVCGFAHALRHDRKASMHLHWKQRPTQTYVCKRLR